MAQWFLAAKKADFEKIGEKFGISAVLARLIRNRDIVGEEEIGKFLNGRMEELYDPFLLKDMEKAVELLIPKIEEGERIRVIGDYDIDGVCASYILVRGLRALGADADAAIPHRIKDGYGLNEALMEEAAAEGIETVVTCDNGIAAAEQIAYGNRMGIATIVTDHHEVPFTQTSTGKEYVLPPAVAVIDPKREDCYYPFKGICGAVVAYKLIEALIKKMEKGDKLRDLQEELLEFAAFATIGDVMELRDENRIVVKYGLSLMENTKNTGLRALLLVTGLEGKKLTPYHIGFVIGPCLNATGRLDTAARALELLLETDQTKAAVIAADLKELNEARKELTAKGLEQAVELVENSALKNDKVLVLFLQECHESLAGIIAGRVREKYGKPVFVLTRGEEGIKGSGRSIEGYHMYEQLTACSRLFTKFGGHKMAAGLSMEEAQAEVFRKEINAACTLTAEDMEEKVHIDIALPLSYVTEQFVDELEKLEPFGVGNPKPVFAQKDIVVLSEQILGKNRNVGKYRIKDSEGRIYELMYFGDVEAFGAYYRQRESVFITYYPSFHEYMGKKSIQIVMQNYK
ncbi:MAG: single-stranded-DNA-specific exonuclease RecJ [Lachnospiraceae bacterium]|nr:single-stranded-DNA-specific exonuclease RecJ [Lachnospiraceae bacterium]